jgi:hypothetical protein
MRAYALAVAILCIFGTSSVYAQGDSITVVSYVEVASTRIGDALHEADRIILLHHGSGVGDAAHVLTEKLKENHPEIYDRIVLQARVDTSAMTEPEILAYARMALLASPGDQP